MLLSRVLLQLCGLLLALAATGVFAGAPLYGPDEVIINVAPSPDTKTRDAQIVRCSTTGGALVPAVTDAVHEMVAERVLPTFSEIAMGWMGASSMQSVSPCPTTRASLDCIWSWDQGRYGGSGNTVQFYRGNRDPIALPGAGMVDNTMTNHWRVYTDASARHPGDKMQRYGAYFRDYYLAPSWADTSDTTWSYATLVAQSFHTFCAIEKTATTTKKPTTTETPRTTTTTAKPSEKDSGVNVPLVVGLSLAAAVFVIVTITVVVYLVFCGGHYRLTGQSNEVSASSTDTASQSGDDCESNSTAPQQGRGSRDSSLHSHYGHTGELRNRSFDDGARGKTSISSRFSVRSFDDDGAAWRKEKEMASAAFDQCAWSQAMAMPPPMMPPQMMPPHMMPPQMMPPQMMPPHMMPPQMIPPHMMPPHMIPPHMMPPQMMPPQMMPPHMMGNARQGR